MSTATGDLTKDLQSAAEERQARLQQQFLPRVYVSGPMTGMPEHNFPTFFETAARLRKLGYRVHNPATKGNPPGWTWEAFMRYDLVKLMDCDAIYMLSGWRKSRGARLEYHVAKELGFTILTEKDLT